MTAATALEACDEQPRQQHPSWSGSYPTRAPFTVAEVQQVIREGQRIDSALYPPRG